jgi:hypothetical protein
MPTRAGVDATSIQRSEDAIGARVSAVRQDEAMDTGRVREERMRSHRLSAPAATVAGAAGHMTAVQAQEFWGGRWALAARAKGGPTLSQVDAAFDRGELVRSWTQRGTLHIVEPRDLGWILRVTAERQTKQYAGVHRGLGITGDDLDRGERAVRAALSGRNRLTRAEFGDVLTAAGVDTAGMRGNHVFSALALRLVAVLGPVLPREGAPSRDQYIVAPEEWITDPVDPADPLAELFVRYLRGHAPAGLADFGWWAGLPKGIAQQALERAGDRVVEVDEGLFAPAGTAPRRSPVPDVVALPPFEEYYLSYVDRSVPVAHGFAQRIGPSLNGIVRPILVAGGEIVGAWSQSLAVGKHHLDPVPELFAPADGSAVDAALARFSRFLRG